MGLGPIMREGKTRTAVVIVLVGCLGACGSKDDEPKPGTGVDLLDPAAGHYDKTYAEWAAGWVQYVNSSAPPDCFSPVSDPTGAECGRYQAAESPVFYLTGNFGGVSIREECVVPSGKALFLPLLSVWGDNAGVPADMLLSDAALQSFVEQTFDVLLPESLKLVVDGHSIAQLERGGIRSAPYTMHLEPDANTYTCANVDGVEGDFSGYLSGYWALLAPLAKGSHTLRFGGESTDGPQGQASTFDIRYTLTVE